MRRSVFCLFLVLSLIICSCDTGEFSIDNSISTIALTPSADQEIILGSDVSFTVSYFPANSSIENVVSWSSSNNNIVTVDQYGKALAVGIGTATITATLKSNSSVKQSVKVTVGSKSTHISSTDKTLTFTNLPEGSTPSKSWIWDDGCVVFAWACFNDGEDNSGDWYKCQKLSETEFTVTVPKYVNKMSFARCYKGTSEPNWDKIGNTVGRIYNQIEPFTITESLSYVADTWQDYLPTIRFRNDIGWSIVKAYFFDSKSEKYDNSIGGTWPGTEMTSKDNISYEIKIPNKADTVVFNNGIDGNENQTVNISLPSLTTTYFLTDQVSGGEDNEKWNVDHL